MGFGAAPFNTPQAEIADLSQIEQGIYGACGLNAWKPAHRFKDSTVHIIGSFGCRSRETHVHRDLRRGPQKTWAALPRIEGPLRAAGCLIST